MPKPSVTTSVVDKTARVSSTGAYNAAIVVAAKKGPINEPTLVTSQTDFLRRFTPNETIELGWDSAHHEAFQYLSTQSNLYVIRAAHTNITGTTDYIPLYGGCHIRLYKSNKEHAPLDEGFANTELHKVTDIRGNEVSHYDTPADVMDTENDAFILYGINQGAFNNDLAVTITTDPKVVKLDGCFIISVYRKDRNTKAYVKLEDHVCSLDPSFKNGYGVNCYVENVLKQSRYVRADVNDDTDLLYDSSFTLAVDGNVTFTNNTIKSTAKRGDNVSPTSGSVIKCEELTTATAYYTCTTAGRIATNAPLFSADGKYLETVEDGRCVWTLTELVKPYETEKTYAPRDIVKITEENNTYYYRALSTGGTTGDEVPEWGEDFVYDGTVTWANQDQVVDVLDAKGYHNRPGVKGETLPLDQYSVYADLYLTTKLELAETVKLQDKTQMVQDVYGNWDYPVVEMAPQYSATYTGEESTEHIVLPKATTELVKLAGGSDGSAVTDADMIKAINTLKNKKTYSVQLIMDGGYTTAAYHQAIDTVCEARDQSTHGICSVPIGNQLVDDNGASVVAYREQELNVNSTNLELYVPHQLIYDQFNDRNIYVSASCFAAAKIMDVAEEYGWHWTAAGINRGVVNSLDVAVDYTDEVVGKFSDAQINTICKEQGEGNVIMDDLTLRSVACDMQDAHISRYVNIDLRPKLEKALKTFLFEFNDDETRTLITKMLENFMRPQIASRAVQDFRVVCDETNNTPQDIQNCICNVWLYIMPTKAIKWIRCQCILTSAGASIESVEEV